MKFTINKRELLNALNLCNRAISSNTPLPSLSGIKIIVNHDDLTLISSDSNISIKKTIKVNDNNILSIKEEGDIILDAKYLLDIVRRMDDDNIAFSTIDGNLIRIANGNSEYKIEGMRAFEYPDINFDTNSEPFILKTNIIEEIIKQTAFACSDKDIKPVLTGINLNAQQGKLYAIASDSHRLASKTIELEKELSFNITVPAKYLIEMYHALGNNEEIKIAIDNQKIIFYFDDTIIWTRLLDDDFPDTSKLIPDLFAQEVTINSHKLLSLIDKCSFIKTNGKSIIKMTLTDNKFEVDSSNQSISHHEETDIISFIGKPLEISCDGKYLEDAVKVFDNEIIKICISGEPKQRIIIKDDNNKNLIQLISPTRNPF